MINVNSEMSQQNSITEPPFCNVAVAAEQEEEGKEQEKKEKLSHRLHKVVPVICVPRVLPLWQNCLFGFGTSI